jgi:uncharacterized membrane protein
MSMTTSDTLANATRAIHDLGLAAWLGGSLFGKFALNPAVQVIDKKTDRGRVVNTAWNGYNVINTLSLAAVTVGWLGARFTEAQNDLMSDTERGLAYVKDGLVAAAVITGVVNGVQGGRLAKQAPEGAVPIETGTLPAPETPPEAAKIQRSLGLFGNLNIITGVALVAVNGVLAQLNYSRPTARRGLTRRS